MKTTILTAFTAGAAASAVLLLSLGAARPGAAVVPAARPTAQDEAGENDMAAMMAQAMRFTQPGEHHRQLERFVGTWKTESQIVMAGFEGKPEPGEAEFSWLIEGRWLRSSLTGTLMGQPMQAFGMLGYDNFKQSFVSARVSSLDTAMTTAEGDMDPSGKALITYGTLDEYLTGEHDKMVKYVWRFVSDDEMHLEVHDLPIGEANTQVIHMVYRRK